MARGAVRSRITVLLLGLMAAVAVPAATQAPPDEKSRAQLTPHGLPLTAQARRDIAQWVLAHPGVSRRDPGHRLAVIRVVVGTTQAASGATRTIVSSVLFDHTAGAARRGAS